MLVAYVSSSRETRFRVTKFHHSVGKRCYPRGNLADYYAQLPFLVPLREWWRLDDSNPRGTKKKTEGCGYPRGARELVIALC